jgi:hypothetical protein
MKTSKIIITLLAAALLTTAAWADDEGERPNRPQRDGQRQRGGDRDGEGRQHKRLEAITAETEEFQTDSTNQLKAIITHAIPAREGEGYHAFVILHWGDLDDELEGISQDYYANWDGQLAITTGTVSVERKLAFDDGEGREMPTLENAIAKLDERRDNALERAENIEDDARRAEVIQKINDRYETALADLEARYEQMADAPEDADAVKANGYDEVTSEADQLITWTAGVVGATDGLAFKLDLPEGTTSGTVTAGEFEFDFEITPLSEEEFEALREQHRQNRRDGEDGEDGDRPNRRPRPHRDNDEGNDDAADEDGTTARPRRQGDSE